ncbi:unnamed protein product [Rotaria magnacalcarata]|nr:unnamed protein product [Rotaria magnacalcarata]CAF4106202.1 unnamed protein product [Rotaria magnacalcarata]CAF4304910.1 unnamed protein product [Rotaria magnacalcarata]CAF4319325.1 unnamed protein product [Rotaria magnacalcarata]
MSLVSSDQSDISSIPTAKYTVTLRQINNRKVGFDFADIELMLFLTFIISTADKAYQITDVSESLIVFSQLIVAQSLHVLRSYTMNQKGNSSSQARLIVSTLYLRPLIESNIASIVYRFIPLRPTINDEKFIYSNMPELITLNTDHQAVLF